MRENFFRIKSSLVLYILACITLVTCTGCDELAQYLVQEVSGRAYKTVITPHWFEDNTRFWYRNDLQGGKREFILVDVSNGVREAAFDHKRLAEALRNAGIIYAVAERLPIDNLYFKHDENALVFYSGENYWQCGLKNYNLHKLEGEEEKTALRRSAPPSVNAPLKTTRTGPATSVTFINKTPGVVRIFWADMSGQRRPYGQLGPGQKQFYQTYTGHVWHVMDSKGALLAGFESQESPIIAEITGEHVVNLEPDESASLYPMDKSPDGKWTVFIENYNVCIRSKDWRSKIQLSHDGIYGNSYTMPRWAPDSKTVVAWRVEPVERKEVHLLESSPDGGMTVNLSLDSYPYPQPGDKLASFELNLLNVETGKQIKPDVDKIDFLQPHLRWNSDGHCFTYEKVDRGHQRFRVIEVNSHTGHIHNIIDEKPKTFIWTNQTFLNRVNWIAGTNEIIYASERDGWQHLYLVDAETGEFKNQITRGEYVVRGIDKIDEEQRQIWFRASGMNSGQDPYLIHYYRVGFDGTGLVALTDGNGNHSIRYSPDRNYIIDTYSRVDMAPVHELRRTSDGNKICTLEQADISELKEKGWKAPEVFAAKGRDGMTDIWGLIYRPAYIDPKRKYPIIEDIYAGPQNSYVPKTFNSLNPYTSLTNLGFIVVKIDGMGTAHRSKAFHDVCWKNFKDAGFPDRILWIKAAAKKYPYMDISRVGIYGASVGGQNAAGALLFHPEFYKVAVGGCGSHDNRLGKALYTEQWMGYPVGPQYLESSNTENAYRLKGKLLLIVGGSDKNVTPKQTLRFADALKRANKDFELLVVPEAGHGLGGVQGYLRMQEFFVQYLKN